MTLRSSWRRGGLALAATTIITVLLATGIGSGPAGASSMPIEAQVTTTTLAFAPGGIPSMLPRPNTGVAPRDADDRGGWAQTGVFLGILASGVIIAGLVFLESRRKLRAQAEAEGGAASNQTVDDSSTRSDPVAETSEKRPESSARQ